LPLIVPHLPGLLSFGKEIATMNRRDFIEQSSLSLVAGLAVALAGCTKEQKNESDDSGANKTKETFELDEVDIEALQAKMNSGSLTSRQLVNKYLERIKSIDRSGPQLRSVIEINPDALAIADQMDEERKNGRTRGPLHGIPVLIKDNIDTADKMQTTAGSLALEGNVASKDAFIVTQLRKAGAVILGKTNLSEWANFRSTRSSSGWSSRGGQTKNPYVLDRTPCGSSSGSGTAVAANLCVVAIGTETNGSIACPSSMNGIVGIKPTVGLWSRGGIIPISHTQDTAGPMARTIRDAALLLGPLAAIDPNDVVVLKKPGNTPGDYTVFLDAQSLNGKKIAVEKSFLKSHEAVDVLLREALDTMSKLGATIVEVELMSKISSVNDIEFDVLKYEFKDGVNKYLSGRNTRVKSLADVIAFNIQNEAKVMPFFKQEILVSSQEKGALAETDYVTKVEKLTTTVRKAIDEILDSTGAIAICGPTNGPSWCVDLVNGDSFTGYAMYSPAAIAGYPSVTVPMGQVFDLPIGLTFIGKAFAEGPLIGAAYAYEQASRKRMPPSFKPSASR
jgi:amidase